MLSFVLNYKMNKTAITITDRKTLIGANFNEFMTKIISVGGNNIKITSQLNALNINGKELRSQWHKVTLCSSPSLNLMLIPKG